MAGKPQTLNPQPSTLNPQPSTLNPQPSTLNGTVLVLMSGFSIGAVLEKLRLSNLIASLVLKPFGNRPKNVLLGIMSLGCFLSMWISNVPSSVTLNPKP
jgi:di/tricarboxylate transporter